MQGTNSIGNVQSGQIQNTSSNAKGKTDKTTGIQQLFENILGNAGSAMTSGNKKTQIAGKSTDAPYSKFKLKENSVPSARNADANEKISNVVSSVSAKADDIKDVIKEQLDISDEEIESVMEQLGFTVMDLLDPQNLADFVSEVKGGLDMTDMIVDSDFQQLLLDTTSIRQEIEQECSIDSSQMDEIISSMEPVQESDNIVLDENYGINLSDTAADSNLDVNTADDGIAAVMIQQDQKDDTFTDGLADKQSDDTVISDENVTAVVVEKEDDMQKNQTAADTDSSDENPDETAGSKENRTQKENGILTEKTSDNVFERTMSNVDNVNPNSQITDASAGTKAPMSGSMIDSLDIIRQVTQQLKVSIASDETSMEMQLNPENLGKIYVNVTQKNSQITAHMMVMNEAVRDALETQLGNLRENLNQAGVKVDAVEVTVASHEFEQNLEQNSSKEQKQNEQSGSFKNTRKNINMSSLDEMSGIMTEEENLVAQMMRDNGNSVDFMA